MCKILDNVEKHNDKFNLNFNEDNHEYFILENDNFKKLISVTTKISKYFPFDVKKVSREVAYRNWVTEDEILDNWKKLQEYGSYIHDLADKYCKSENLNSHQLELIENVVSFFQDYPKYEIIASELKIFSSKYQVAGTVDLIIKDKTNNRYYILDWKTSNKKIDKNQIFNMAKLPFSDIPNNKFYIYSMQLSCYNIILKEEYGIEIWDSIIIHLKQNQTYEIIEPMNLLYEAKILLEL